MLPTFDRQQLKGAALFLAICTACLLAFWPGLTGPFLFDDFPNLADLGLLGGIHDLTSAARFILGGHAGPLGRPLSLASFVINDNGWPSDPYGFKYTNLLLHLLTGITLYALLRQLRLPGGAPTEPVALVSSGLWLLHPIQTAPVFLVVQRMTILSALFSLMGMAMWLAGRNRLVDGRPHGWRWMTAAILLGTPLAVLSKENGALLPMLILVLERTLAPLPQGRSADRWRRLFLTLPSLAIAAYFALSWHQITAGYVGRDFTLQQRLLTEPLILLDYLKEIVIPGITATIFRDDFTAVDARSPLAFVALGVLALSLLAGLMLRSRAPLAAFAILVFLAGHCLESGPIPLELYFIHRNYLPMVGVLLLIVHGAAVALRAYPVLLRGLSFGALALLASLTWASSRYWGDEAMLVNAWADERPASPRAAAMAGNYWGQRRQFEKAIAIVERTLSLHPGAPSLQIGNYYEHCLAKREDRTLWDALLRSIPSAPMDNAMTDAMEVLVVNIVEGDCKRVTIDDVIAALDAYKRNPRYDNPVEHGRLDYTIAALFLQKNDVGSAVGALEKTVAEAPTVYAYELLGDLYEAQGETPRAIDSYRRALAIPYFRGWRARLVGAAKPAFPVLEKKLADLESQAAANAPAGSGPRP